MDSQATLKKLAEVAALADLLSELNTRSGGLLDDRILNHPIRKTLIQHRAAHYVPTEYLHMYEQKYKRTTAKLAGMMETYIGEKWDDPIELSEWCGFHLGAGLVHAALVQNSLPAHQKELAEITQAFAELLQHVQAHIVDHA